MKGVSLMRLRKLFLAVVAAVNLAFMVPISPVLAQGEKPTSLKNVLVSVYPEYDDLLQLGYPSVLVMLEGEVVSANLPATIRFLVPSDAEMYSAGSGPRNQYVGGPPIRNASNITGWDEISYELKTKYFVVEYYAPITGQPDRVIPYDFYPLYPVSNLRTIIQEPRRATNVTVTPHGTIGTDGEGFRIHAYNQANVNPGTSLHFDISYTKKDTRPSIGGDTGSPNTTVLIVMGSIAALVGTFIFVSKLRSRRPQPTASRSLRRQAARTTKGGQGRNKYCRYCGKPVQDTDRFCPHCGKKFD